MHRVVGRKELKLEQMQNSRPGSDINLLSSDGQVGTSRGRPFATNRLSEVNSSSRVHHGK